MRGEGSCSRAAGGRAERRKAGQLPLSDSPGKLPGGHLAPSPPRPQPARSRGSGGRQNPAGSGHRAAPLGAQRPPPRRPLTCAAAAPRQRPPPPRPSARPAQRHAGPGAGGARRCRSPWGRAEPCRAAPLRAVPCRAAALPPAPPAPAGKVGQGGTEHARGRAGGRPRGPRGAAGGRRRSPRRGHGARGRPLRVPSGAAQRGGEGSGGGWSCRGRCRARRGKGEGESSGGAESRGTLTPGSRAQGPGAGPTAWPTRRAGVGAGTGKTGLRAACLLLPRVPGWANR